MKAKRLKFMVLAMMLLAMCCREDVRAIEEQGGETTISIHFLPPDTDAGREEKGMSQEDKTASPTKDSLSSAEDVSKKGKPGTAPPTQDSLSPAEDVSKKGESGTASPTKDSPSPAEDVSKKGEPETAPPTGDSLLPAAIWTAVFFSTGLFLIMICLKRGRMKRKKLFVLCLGLFMLLSAKPALVKADDNRIPADKTTAVASGGASVEVTFRPVNYTLMIPSELKFADVHWEKGRTYTGDFQIAVTGMEQGAIDLGYRVQVLVSGDQSSGEYSLINKVSGEKLAYKIEKEGGIEIPANKRFATFQQNDQPQKGRVILNSPDGLDKIGKYEGRLIFTAELVPPSEP